MIYRREGPGTVHSGDIVGIYYPHEDKWFSMYRGQGHKGACPGSPNIETGFSEDSLWSTCSPTVFLVFAEGKSNGEQIVAGDRLAFFYPANPNHVQFSATQVTLSQCMREKSTSSSKPSNYAFIACEEEILWLAIR